jgi:hypothetical protein
MSKLSNRVSECDDEQMRKIMDAIAQAIELSQTVIICMSEDYRNSNHWRVEAHYAFQHQRKILPVLLQKHYRPDGWMVVVFHRSIIIRRL